MASGNFLTVKTHLSEFKNNSDKDTLSEASESGTSNSVTSAEELQKLALILGLNSAEDVYQERFRVDRRRLEAMLADNLEESQTAQAFFHRVMNETNTLINWPARLKIGARSKKDPHVRVAGRPDDVKLAREKIMQLLDTRSNRVTMKIDVSYTDHSHIIGKGGLTIKRVMEETGCHIHFPDSNRTSTVEKSNQVSIAGDMERVERARARVRALTPLVFCFELPIVAPSQPLPDISSPYVQQVQEQYNVQVMLRNRPKLHANLLVVKGVQWEVKATMEATSLLMNYMCGPLAAQTQVQMSLEISPMHHAVVMGRGAEQLKVIMKGTGTQIMFPDADDPNIPALKKSCVTITGQIKEVYAARQQLVGSLPLVVIFDVPEEACRVDSEAAAKLMQKHNVYINIRRKPKQGIASIVIKGIERCAGDIYEARRELLGGKEPVITAEVPESYNIPAISSAMPNFGVFNPFSPSHSMASPCSPYMQDAGSYASPLGAQGFPGPLSPALTPPAFAPWLVPSPPPRLAQFHYPMPAHAHGHGIYKNQQSWNPMTSNTEMNNMNMQQPMMVPQQYQQMPDHRPTTLSQLLNSSSQASSGYQSNFTGSSASLDAQNISGGDGSNVASPSVSPISKAHSPNSARDHHEINELANIISDLPLSERRAPGCEKKTLETLNKLSPLADYRRMKADATKAMREAVGSGSRVPTPRWAGYYFSHTSPGPLALPTADSNQTTVSMNSPLTQRQPRWAGYYFSHTSPGPLALPTADSNQTTVSMNSPLTQRQPRWAGYYFSHTSPGPLALPTADSNQTTVSMNSPLTQRQPRWAGYYFSHTSPGPLALPTADSNQTTVSMNSPLTQRQPRWAGYYFSHTSPGPLALPTADSNQTTVSMNSPLTQRQPRWAGYYFSHTSPGPLALPTADSNQTTVSMNSPLTQRQPRWAGYYFSHTSPGPLALPTADSNQTTVSMNSPLTQRQPRWAGYYFSHTSPGPLALPTADSNQTTPEKGWNRVELTRPNIAEPASPAQATGTGRPCRYQQLYDLLRDIGLHKYIDLFKKHELDMSTFASLNEADLTEIGITAFGARRKMLLVIAELQKQSGAMKGTGTGPRKLPASPPYSTPAITDKW